MHQAVARSQLAVCRRKATNWRKKTAAIGIGEKVDHNHLEVSEGILKDMHGMACGCLSLPAQAQGCACYSIYQSIHPSIYPSICLSIYPSNLLSRYLSNEQTNWLTHQQANKQTNYLSHTHTHVTHTSLCTAAMTDQPFFLKFPQESLDFDENSAASDCTIRGAFCILLALLSLWSLIDLIAVHVQCCKSH